MEKQLQKIVEDLESTKISLLDVKKELDSTKISLLEVKEELDSTKKRLSKVEWELDSTNRRLEELGSLKTSFSTRIIKDKNEASSSSQRSMKLVLRNGICQTILTGEEIKGEDGTSIEVALVDNSTGDIVNVERESSSKVEIVLVKGEFDATTESFQENIVPEMEGKRPLLEGKVRVKLQRGVAILDSLKLRHHTSKIRPSEFRLGARVVDTFDRARVKEAITHSFTVNNFRKKYTYKHKNPSLSDEVWRLVFIKKGGPIHKRLTSKKICTVEDFLIRLLINPKGLKSIVDLRGKKWEATVNNARACTDHKRMYCFVNSQKTMAVVFNVLGVLGLYLENQHFPTNMLSKNHKADAQELLESAYKHWEDAVVFFDDEDSLQQHLKKSLQQPCTNSQDYNPLVSHDNPYGCDPYETSPANIITDTATLNHDGESSNGNFSFESLMSAMNSVREEDFGSEMIGGSSNGHSNSSFESLMSDSNLAREEYFGSEMIGGSSNGHSNSSFQSLMSDSNLTREEYFGSEMIGGSSNGHSNSSFQSLMNAAGEEDFGSYYDAQMQLSPPPPFDKETHLLGLHEFLYQNDHFDMSNADEEMNASPCASRGDNIGGGKGSKMWKTIYKRMKMVFSITKLVKS